MSEQFPQCYRGWDVYDTNILRGHRVGRSLLLWLASKRRGSNGLKSAKIRSAHGAVRRASSARRLWCSMRGAILVQRDLYYVAGMFLQECGVFWRLPDASDAMVERNEVLE